MRAEAPFVDGAASASGDGEPRNVHRRCYPGLTRIPSPSERDFHEHFERCSRPVVLEGFAAGSIARRLWSPSYLAERFGDVPVRAYALADGRFRIDRSQGFEIRELPLRDYVEQVRAGSGEFYLRAALHGRLAPLAHDIETPRYFARRGGVRKNLWFASAGTVTPLHFDLPDNLFVQLWGRKRFILFSPTETRRLYGYGWASSTPHLARLDPERPDEQRFPRFRMAQGGEALLEPGDALFIPARFWHHARALSDTIGVNFWSPTGFTRPLLAVSDLYKRLRGLNI